MFLPLYINVTSAITVVCGPDNSKCIVRIHYLCPCHACDMCTLSLLMSLFIPSKPCTPNVCVCVPYAHLVLYIKCLPGAVRNMRRWPYELCIICPLSLYIDYVSHSLKVPCVPVLYIQSNLELAPLFRVGCTLHLGWTCIYGLHPSPKHPRAGSERPLNHSSQRAKPCQGVMHFYEEVTGQSEKLTCSRLRRTTSNIVALGCGLATRVKSRRRLPVPIC